MAPKIVQDSPRWFKIAINIHPRALETAPGRLQVPFELSIQGGTQEAKILQIPCVFLCCLHSRRFASDRRLRPQDGSKMAQEGPKRGPGGLQDGPKRVPRGSFSGPDGGRELPPPSLIDGPSRPPRGPPESPRRVPREPQEGPGSLQDGPRRASKRALGAPQEPKRAAREHQEGSRSLQDGPKRAPRWLQEASKT